MQFEIQIEVIFKISYKHPIFESGKMQLDRYFEGLTIIFTQNIVDSKICGLENMNNFLENYFDNKLELIEKNKEYVEAKYYEAYYNEILIFVDIICDYFKNLVNIENNKDSIINGILLKDIYLACYNNYINLKQRILTIKYSYVLSEEKFNDFEIIGNKIKWNSNLKLLAHTLFQYKNIKKRLNLQLASDYIKYFITDNKFIQIKQDPDSLKKELEKVINHYVKPETKIENLILKYVNVFKRTF